MSPHPAATQDLPAFIAGPGGADALLSAVPWLVHAMLLRVQALLLPVKLLVVAGH